MANEKVGPFFWIQGKLIAYPDSIEDGLELCPGKVDGKAGHYTEYQKLPQRFEHDYDYWPRGRVVFDKTKNRAIVYLDRCIKSDEDVHKAIVQAYALDPQRTSWRLEGHYQCHCCNKGYSDLVGY